ncbi:transmembrane amino acid transporter protein-domain-containing protein [Zychaea mexicana]|uniref:transmembrane amino acid transporter protein-domain-containing protein n=1 Tax=Zychaea mexicana TaxID=64656 RepID=UPI0022FEE9DB|nr:transmembrane amino acid transporter protein-domain-containing protein [Zychaea mexicana]KAI9471390.1 transmembrane amino acid transporter protein-domain-containing protein [Zychaea mexicana]
MEESTVSSDTFEKVRIGNVSDCDRSNAGGSLYAYWNIICVICGVGILGLPQALSKGGWAALTLLLLSWFFAIYCSIILIRCLYYSRKQETRLPSFTAIAEDAFGQIGGYILFFFQAWILLGGPVLIFVLCGTNMNELCRGTSCQVGAVPWTIIFCAAVAIPLVFLKSMKDTGWTSILGTVAIVAVSLICVIMAGLDNPNETIGIVNITHTNVIWEGFPAALSTMSLSFGGNVVYPNIEASMKKPHHWPYVVAGALTTCALLYIMVAVSGYYVYGDAVLNPVYYSIPNGPPRLVCIAFITVNITVCAPILLTSFVIEAEAMMGLTVERLGRAREFISRASFRILTAAFCGAIGCVVPYFDHLMALFGAFGFCTTTFIFPILCWWKMTGVRSKPYYQLAWDILILIFGTVGLVFGSWSAIRDLVYAFKNGA